MPDPTQINRVYLSLGSNIEPERHLPAAVAQLAQFGRVREVSTVWQTAPIGFTDQPDFLNAAILLETTQSAQALREQIIPQIEESLGRVRTENKNAPRTIDIDIMLFNHDVLSLGQRHIPDPEVLERPFVAIPLAEIDPHYVHPEIGQSLRSIAERFTASGSAMCQRDDVVLLSDSLKQMSNLPENSKLLDK
jgi:2-amino-4-hydroxy-6-hydroxymethyldihydropteridine diphosphokinase